MGFITNGLTASAKNAEDYARCVVTEPKKRSLWVWKAEIVIFA